MVHNLAIFTLIVFGGGQYWLRRMKIALTYFWSIILPLVPADQFPQTTRTCATGETCESEESCAWVTEKYTQIKTTASGHIKQSIIDELRAVICNRAKKAFCCPHPQDYSAISFPTKHCSADETCSPEESCKWVRNKYQEAKTAPDPHTKQTVINQINAAICDRAKKAFCCPHPQDYSTISFPTKHCSADETCSPEESCEWARNKYREAKTAPDPQTKQTVINELKAAVCDRAKKAFCCPPPKISNLKSADSYGTYLPSPEQCGGRKKEFSLYVIGGEGIVPGDFPFTALLGYSESCRRNDKKVRCIKYLCGGSLINRKYVLTAAHCMKVGKRKQGVREVLLGEWNVHTPVDCERSYAGGNCITDPLPKPQKFRISKSDITIHPEYGRGEGSNIKINDIALIRLPRLAELNEGTQMVCLPLHERVASRHLGVPNLKTGLLGTTPTVVGWGYTTYNPWQGDYQDGFGQGNGDVATSTPNKLSHGLLSNSGRECSAYSLLSSQICGDMRMGEGACLGDSGTGLYLNGSFVEMEGGAPWYQLGIVSYGGRYCDAGKPVIYTRVSSYIPWIKQNLKP